MRVPARITLVLCVLALGWSARVSAQVPAPTPDVSAVDSVKLQLIRAVLVETHASDLMFRSMQAALPAQRAANPAIPAAVWDRFLAAAVERKGELDSLVIQIYDRHFSADDLRGLLAFYRSPIGQRLIAEQAAISQEAIVAGQQWGQRVGFEVGQQMAREAHTGP